MCVSFVLVSPYGLEYTSRTVYSRRDKSVEHKRKKKQKKEAVCLHLLKDVGEMYTVNLPPL